MKLIKCTNLLVLGLAVSIFAGCHGKGYHKTTDLHGYPAGKVGGEDLAGNKVDLGQQQLTGVIPLSSKDWWATASLDRETLKAETVYFDFDSSVVKGSEKSKIQAVAEFLRKTPGSDVRVEGNCDERGTEGYNDSLGSKRAMAVREALVALGISPDRVDSVSFGESRPAAQGHDEAAWSKNRRDEFVVLTPK